MHMHRLAVLLAGAVAALTLATGSAGARGTAAGQHSGAGIRVLPDLGYGGEVIGSNARHLFVGGVVDATGAYHPAYWSSGRRRLHVVRTGLPMGELFDVNGRGEMVGTARSASGVRRSYVVLGSRLHFLRGLGGSDTAARHLNDRGQIAGFATDAGDAHTYAVVWASYRARPRILHPAAGDVGSTGIAIDPDGDVAGDSDGPPPAFRFRPAIWVRHLGVRILPTTTALPSGSVHGLSRGGAAVGEIDRDDFTLSHAAFWSRSGRLRDLGTLPGHPSSVLLGRAGNGLAVGVADDLTSGTAPFVPVLWPGHGRLLELPGLRGGHGQGNAHAIESDGTAAGTAADAGGVLRAVVWVDAPRLAFRPH